jgi:hypothetical protein
MYQDWRSLIERWTTGLCSSIFLSCSYTRSAIRIYTDLFSLSRWLLRVLSAVLWWRKNVDNGRAARGFPKKKDAIDGDYNPDNDTHSTNLHSAPLAHVAVMPYSFLYVPTYAHTFFRRGTLIDSWKINQKKKSETRMEMRISNGGEMSGSTWWWWWWWHCVAE